MSSNCEGKEVDTAIYGSSDKKILYRFHSDLTNDSGEPDATTTLSDTTLEFPITFESDIFTKPDNPRIVSRINPDGNSRSKIDSTINPTDDSIHTVITNVDGEQTHKFDSQLHLRHAAGEETETDTIESNFRDSAQSALKTLSCTFKENSETKLEIKCHPVK